MNVSVRNTQLLIWTFPLCWVTVNSCCNQKNAQGTHRRPDRSSRTWVVLCTAMEVAQLTIFGIFSLIKPLRGKVVHYFAESELRHSKWLNDLPKGIWKAMPQQEAEFWCPESLACSPNTSPSSTLNLFPKACTGQQEIAEKQRHKNV